MLPVPLPDAVKVPGGLLLMASIASASVLSGASSFTITAEYSTLRSAMWVNLSALRSVSPWHTSWLRSTLIVPHEPRAARAVGPRDRLAKLALHCRGQGADQDIRAATRSPGHDHGDRPVWKVLRQRRRRREGDGGQRSRDARPGTLDRHVSSSLFHSRIGSRIRPTAFRSRSFCYLRRDAAVKHFLIIMISFPLCEKNLRHGGEIVNSGPAHSPNSANRSASCLDVLTSPI
jgi:hypothetical protein